jgi:hypothetical protein
VRAAQTKLLLILLGRFTPEWVMVVVMFRAGHPARVFDP